MFCQLQKGLMDLTMGLKVDTAGTLMKIESLEENMERVVVNAHNNLCNDVEEMDYKLEMIHGRKYNNDYRRGKRKIIFKK